MATSTITNTVTDPSGAAVSGVRVVAHLLPVPGFRTSDGTGIAQQVETTTNGNGDWSLTLERNADIIPTNTYYEITEYIRYGGRMQRATYNIQVGASNKVLSAAIVNPLPANPGVTAHTHTGVYVTKTGDSMSGRLLLVNVPASTQPPLDIQGWQGQGETLPDARTVQVHHYTDTDAMWIDNVGDGVTLRLNLAHNPTNRPDKPANYVGGGKYLSLNKYNTGTGIYDEYFFANLQSGGVILTWTTGIAKMISNKADDGNYAYVFDATNTHANYASFGTVLEILNDVSKTRAAVQSKSGQTNGLILSSVAGPVTVTAGNGTIQLNSNLKLNYATSSTVGAAGAAAALPATPQEYITVNTPAGARKIPAYLT